MGWNPETIDLAFEKIKKDFKAKKVRILFGESVSYVLKIEIPTDIEKGREEEFISQKITEQIPELLERGDWGHQEIDHTEKDEKVASREFVVFAPVKEVFQSVVSSVKKTGLEVETLEPEQIAKTRDVNPIIGIALKENTGGRHELINLGERNVIDSKESALSEDKSVADSSRQEDAAQESLGESSGQRRKKLIALLLVVIILLIWLGAVWYFLFYSRRTVGEEAGDDVVTTITPIPSLEVTETPIQAETEVDLKGFSIQVLNGSGTEGEASYASDLLTQIGFENIETGNATSSAFVETEVRINEGTPQLVYEKINEALGETYILASSSASLDNFDVIVTVGERKED